VGHKKTVSEFAEPNSGGQTWRPSPGDWDLSILSTAFAGAVTFFRCQRPWQAGLKLRNEGAKMEGFLIGKSPKSPINGAFTHGFDGRIPQK